VKIVTFSFETSPNARPTRKSVGTWHIMSPCQIVSMAGSTHSIPSKVFADLITRTI